MSATPLQENIRKCSFRELKETGIILSKDLLLHVCKTEIILLLDNTIYPGDLKKISNVMEQENLGNTSRFFYLISKDSNKCSVANNASGDLQQEALLLSESSKNLRKISNGMEQENMESTSQFFFPTSKEANNAPTDLQEELSLSESSEDSDSSLTISENYNWGTEEPQIEHFDRKNYIRRSIKFYSHALETLDKSHATFSKLKNKLDNIRRFYPELYYEEENVMQIWGRSDLNDKYDFSAL